jgi:hypothetical protein
MSCSRGAIANGWQKWHQSRQIKTIQKRIEEVQWQEVKETLAAKNDS